ncbi:catalase [Solimonas marina]|uniref:Catalase n=1 Tax=Solimonas marina TaxID=2714601 RepID=A0A969WGR8_9GAMM|nr:catalase [Solimonas marina]
MKTATREAVHKIAKKVGEPASEDTKTDQLETVTEGVDGKTLTTQQGLEIADNQNSLKIGERGPTLLEDFMMREKITHFDHERIPERVVHARGAGAHGYFELYDSLGAYTTAAFLCETGVKTPVFVRFSTVAGSRGSADTVRDVRGFATKFYTSQGNFDLVGNNMPVFFIQDAIKFPDFIHAVKPEPHNEIPQAQSAHDTFWDFVSLNTELSHMLMWVMSDRALPRSFAMMEGFGVHTFRLVNAEGISHFVKFHWKPKLGAHSLSWDEAQKIAGKDPDFNRRELWESIEAGQCPEWELGLQIVAEHDADTFEFDLLDPTKIIPEELVPVRRVGRMVLNRNPENYFAETEQVAFCVANVVPGIDFTNDPLMQGRLFSYLDTQLLRLGGPNFAHIPINRPLCPVNNNQRDGFQQQRVFRGRTSYEPNSISRGCPMQSGDASAFRSYPETFTEPKVRKRSARFADHFTQATLFYASQTPVEQKHIIDAIAFELSHVEEERIRERVVRVLANIDRGLAENVAAKVAVTDISDDLNYLKEETTAPLPDDRRGAAAPGQSQALSLAYQPQQSIETRRIAILAAENCLASPIVSLKAALEELGAVVAVVAPRLGALQTADEVNLEATYTTESADSVLFDAVIVAGGATAVETLKPMISVRSFLLDAFRHCKTILVMDEGTRLLTAAGISELSMNDKQSDEGLIVHDGPEVENLIANLARAIARHRHWQRRALLSP